MNRLQLRTEPSHSSTVRRADRGHAPIARGHSAAPALFVPLHYEANYAYPLIVWLHGSGDNERQLLRIMPHLSLRNYVAVGPRGTSTCTRTSGAFTWDQSERDILLAENRVMESIELAQSRCHIHPQRIFLAGYQEGGSMALRIGMQFPDLFAGVVTMSGPFPAGFAPLSRLKSVRHLPLLATYGCDERLYSAESVRRDLHLLHCAGLKAQYRQYPCGDDMTTKMLEDVNVWLMERVTGVPESESVAQTARLDWN